MDESNEKFVPTERILKSYKMTTVEEYDAFQAWAEKTHEKKHFGSWGKFRAWKLEIVPVWQAYKKENNLKF